MNRNCDVFDEFYGRIPPNDGTANDRTGRIYGARPSRGNHYDDDDDRNERGAQKLSGLPYMGTPREPYAAKQAVCGDGDARASSNGDFSFRENRQYDNETKKTVPPARD